MFGLQHNNDMTIFMLIDVNENTVYELKYEYNYHSFLILMTILHSWSTILVHEI